MPETRLFLIQSFALSGIVVAALAAVLWSFHRREIGSQSRPWAFSSLALALFFVTGALNLSQRHLDITHPLRLSLSISWIAAGFAHVLWLASGTLQLIGAGRPAPRHRETWILMASLALGATLTLSFAFVPDAFSERYFLRVGVRALLTGITLFGVGVILARSWRDGRELGRRLLTFVCLLTGGLHLYQAAYSTAFFFGRPFTTTAIPVGQIESVLQLASCIGFVLWMYEELNIGLEERVRKRTEELQRVNAELESYSSSVSHDLRNPLQTILTVSELLAEEHSSDQGRKDAGTIRSEAVRMSEIIESLLRLSQSRMTDLHRAPVDLSELGRQVVRDLRRRNPTRKVDCQIADGLVALGDASLLRLVLENLFDNAWKFTRLQSNAQVELGKGLFGGEQAFFVQDNGVGFDAAAADELFGEFHRLRHDQFEGFGVGLATVRRIVQLHGGRVGAESEEDCGATFWIAIPEMEVASPTDDPLVTSR